MSIDQYTITHATNTIQVTDGTTGLQLTSASNTNTFFRFDYNNSKLATSPDASSTEETLWIFTIGQFVIEASVSFTPTDCIQVTNSDPINIAHIQISFSGVVTEMDLPPNQSIFINPNTSPPMFTQTVCCVHPDTLVQTPNGMITIKDIKKGDQVIAKGDTNSSYETIEVKYNIRYIPSIHFVKIDKGALGKDQSGNDLPNQDLLIRRGHPILLDDKEINCTDLLNGNSIKDVQLEGSTDIWSLCTEHRSFVMMNGIQ